MKLYASQIANKETLDISTKLDYLMQNLSSKNAENTITNTITLRI